MTPTLKFTHCANCGFDLTDPNTGEPVEIKALAAPYTQTYTEPVCPECGSPDIIEANSGESYADAKFNRVTGNSSLYA